MGAGPAAGTTAGSDLASTTLDLSTPSPAAPPKAPAVPARRTPTARRAPTGAHTILTPQAPTVTLTRLQTGIGTLTIEAVCSEQVGDLRLGCAYQLRSGHTSTVQLADGSRFGPRDTRRPVIVASREQYERISLDLRQCAELERLGVYAFSASRTQLQWGGTLVVSTFGGARIDIPLEFPTTGAVAVLMSLYQVRGEFVLRSELEPFDGSVRDACRAYGYDRITWLDDRTPVS
jgi:uncharacterized protein involved in tellurium resistance